MVKGMRCRHILLVGALAAVMSVSSVAAEDTHDGLLYSLFGEGGPLSEVLPEGTDIDTVLDNVKEKLDQADSEIGSLLSRIDSIVKQGADNINLDVFVQYVEGLVGNLLGGGDSDFDFSSLDAYFEISDSYRGAEEQYIKERNAEAMDIGDVQIISDGAIYTTDYELDTTEIVNMAAITQNNYKLDDDNQLLFVSGAMEIVLFEHQKDEEGNFPVTKATFAEDGENYTSSIEKMCNEVGITLDECFESIDISKVMVAYDLKQYLNDHPDIKGIEYEGEIRTAEELDQIWSDELAELYPSEEEALTEDTGTLE